MNAFRTMVATGLAGLLALSAPMAKAEETASFSPYLVGTWDLRSGNTLLQVVNPTARSLELLVAFFDDNEKGLKCLKEKLSHNDLLEVNVAKINPGAKLGVVKIVSHLNQRPTPGVVGFQRQISGRTPVSESNLAAVPAGVLDEELKLILEVCH